MPCRICGNPKTIEAHILPRWSVRRVAGTGQHAVVGYVDRLGTQYDGKGAFDPNLLCAKHEDAFREGDDYAARFLSRNWQRGSVAFDGKVWLAPNPKPHLLVRFAAGCLWKRWASPVRAAGTPLDLGPWEHQLRRFLFEGVETYEPQLVLLRERMLLAGEETQYPLLTDPYAFPSWGRRAYTFQFGDCHFLINLDKRQSYRDFIRVQANGQDPVPAMIRPDRDWMTEHDMLTIVANMRSGLSSGE
jgi:hypothetical protein